MSGLHAVNAMNTSIRIDFPGIFRPFGADKAGTGVSPQFRMYRCRDGVWLFVCALTPSFFFKLLEALDLMDIMLIPEVDGEFAKFVTPPVQAIANERFAARMAELDSDQWAARFDEIGRALRAGADARGVGGERDGRRQRPAAAGARRRQARSDPGLPAVLSRTPGTLAPSAAAEPSARDAAAPGSRRCRSTAMLVVDATKFLAGPFGCLVLQDLGARVVKVDPPGGEEFRAVAAASYSALNRDKDQVCLDLKDAAGREAFTALVHRADALVENMSRQVASELGLDLDGLRAGNPGLVHSHIDGWGKGPLADTPGFDPLLQARSGIMVAQGGADHPVIQPMSLHDIGTGTLAAFGTIAGLYARTHLGEGQDVGVALSRTSVAFQGGEYTTAPDLADPVLGYIDYVGDEPDHCFVGSGRRLARGRGHHRRAACRVVDDPRRRRARREYRRRRSSMRAAPRASPRSRCSGATRCTRATRWPTPACWLVVDDDDLGEVKVIRDYSQWDGVAAARRARTCAPPGATPTRCCRRSARATDGAEAEVDEVVDLGRDRRARPARGARPAGRTTACATSAASSSGRRCRARRTAPRSSVPGAALAAWRPGADPPLTLPPFQITARVVAATSSSACDSTPSTQRRTCASGVRAFAIWCVEVAAQPHARRRRASAATSASFERKWR